MTNKSLLKRLREIAPDLAAQILDNARAENLSPANVEAKLKSALEWQMHRERVENDLKARGIELSEDDLDEVASELLLLPTLLQRMETEGLKRQATIPTDELLKRLETATFEELARDAVRQYQIGETVSLRKLAEAKGIQIESKDDKKDQEPIPAETPDGMVYMRLRALQERLKNSPEYQADMEELHRIRAEIWRKEQGLSLDERIEKTRRESQKIIDKYGLRVLEDDDDPRKTAKKLEAYLKALEHMKTDDEGD